VTVDVELTVNGVATQLQVADAELVGDTLRDRLDLKSVRYGCMEGVCGSCTILVDGAPARGCLLLTAQLDGATLVTVEGLEKDGELSPLQQAVVDHGAFQCGFCISGFLITATAYLERHPSPSRDEIAEALAGNLCRCTGYVKILDAVEAAAAGSSPEASAPLVP
jgi:aerobic carbon-monoxide dehydrogenase small subunit